MQYPTPPECHDNTPLRSSQLVQSRGLMEIPEYIPGKNRIYEEKNTVRKELLLQRLQSSRRRTPIHPANTARQSASAPAIKAEYPARIGAVQSKDTGSLRRSQLQWRQIHKYMHNPPYSSQSGGSAAQPTDPLVGVGTLVVGGPHIVPDMLQIDLTAPEKLRVLVYEALLKAERRGCRND